MGALRDKWAAYERAQRRGAIAAPSDSPPEGAEGALWLVTDDPEIEVLPVASFNYGGADIAAYAVMWLGGVAAMPETPEAEALATWSVSLYEGSVYATAEDYDAASDPSAGMEWTNGIWYPHNDGGPLAPGRHHLYVDVSGGVVLPVLPTGMSLVSTGGSLRWWDVDGEQWVAFPEPEGAEVSSPFQGEWQEATTYPPGSIVVYDNDGANVWISSVETTDEPGGMDVDSWLPLDSERAGVLTDNNDGTGAVWDQGGLTVFTGPEAEYQLSFGPDGVLLVNFVDVLDVINARLDALEAP